MTKHTVGPPIVIGYVTGGLSTAYFQQCLTQATHHSLVDPNVIPFIGSPHLSVNRNMVTMRFLRDLRHPWLLMVDDDMVFTTDDIEVLSWSLEPGTASEFLVPGGARGQTLAPGGTLDIDIDFGGIACSSGCA